MSRSNPLNSFIRTRCGASGPRGDGAGPTAPGARRSTRHVSVAMPAQRFSMLSRVPRLRRCYPRVCRQE